MPTPTDVAKASSAEMATTEPSPLAPGETLEAFLNELQAQPLGAEDFLLPREDAPAIPRSCIEALEELARKAQELRLGYEDEETPP